MTLSPFSPLKPTLAAIRERTAANEELRSAHHFLFALPRNVGGDGSVKIVIIGANPGESDFDRKHSPGNGHEESFERDFHELARVRAPASRRWLSHVDFFTDYAPTVLTEIFFWSSKNVAELTSKYGKLSQSKHLDFCCNCNLELFQTVKPAIVIGVGLGMTPLAIKSFNLKLDGIPIRCKSTNHKLIDRFSDGERPWVFTKHWSGSRGFTTAQKAVIRDYIRNAIGGL